MSTLQVANVQTGSGTTDLTISTLNTAGSSVKLYSNASGLALLSNSSTTLLSVDATSNVVVFNNFFNRTLTNLTLTSNSVIFSGNVTPTELTANAAAYNPDSTDIAFTIRVSANSTSNTANTAYGPGYEPTIFGIAAGANGQIYTISNIGSQKIRLKKEDSLTESTAGNRFNIPNDVWLYGYQSVQIIYDGTLARWRLLNGVGASPANSLGYYYDNTVTLRMDHKYSLVKGFFAGGQIPTSPVITVYATTDRTTYSSETTAAVSGANLSQARYGIGSSGNADKGFFAGGSTGSAVATADRTTYSSETTAAVTGANLSQARYGIGSSGNADKGFFAGGSSPTIVTTADRSTYSTETTAAVTGTNLSQARYLLAATGNSDKGFFAGGASTIATADRTTYSTETTAAVVGANLSQGRYYLGGAGNADKGFFSGGYVAPAGLATADRTTYSSETTAAVTGANLSQARYGVSGAGNADKGFFSGGYVAPAGLATADRTTYSSETTAAVVGANLSQARSTTAAI